MARCRVNSSSRVLLIDARGRILLIYVLNQQTAEDLPGVVLPEVGITRRPSISLAASERVRRSRREARRIINPLRNAPTKEAFGRMNSDLGNALPSRWNSTSCAAPTAGDAVHAAVR